MRAPLWRFVLLQVAEWEKMSHIFSQFLASGSRTSVASCLVIYSPDDKKALNCSTNYTATPLCHRQNRKSGFCPHEMASKRQVVLSVLSNPVPTPSHVPVWGFAAPQNRLGNSTNDLPGKSQRAAITRSFADAPLLHGAHVWFLSGRPSFSLSLPLSLHFYHSLILLSVSPTSFHSFIPVLWPWQSVSFSLQARLSFPLGSAFLSITPLPPLSLSNMC